MNSSRKRYGYVAGILGVGVMGSLVSLQIAVALPPFGSLWISHHHGLAQVAAVLSLGIGMAVTMEALHRAHAAADRGAARFAQLFKAEPLAKSLTRIRDRRVVEVNEAYTKLFGVAYEAVVGRTSDEAGFQASAEARAEMFAALTSSSEPQEREFQVHGPDGVLRTLLVTCQIIEIAGEQMMLSSFLDLTARRKAEAEANAAGERLKELAEIVDASIWMVDAMTGEALYVSSGYERIWGRSREEYIENSQGWIAAVHPDDRRQVVEQLARGNANAEFRIVQPDGTIRWVSERMVEIRDGKGAVVRLAGITVDITARKEAEARTLAVEQKLQQAQKLESIGLLAGGIAHDFNNILCVITGNAETLAADLGADHAGRAMLDEIQLATERATSLTRQLLAFSRKQIVKPVVLEVNRAVDDARRMLRRMLGEDIALHVALDPDAGSVRIDPAQLTQVLMNLCLNARDAIGTAGTITLETRSSRDAAVIVVSDSGHGMTEEVKKHVFEPFFTTKETGRGTGLGLAVVHGIVEQAGGTIEVESELGRGTTFRIRIPVVAHAGAPRRSGPIEVVPGRESILVVDDDEHVRRAASRALKRLGYDVSEACDGIDALRLIRNPARRIDLIVTDVVMPNMGGRELAEQAVLVRPAVPVLYLSGYTDDEVMQRGVEQHEVLFLQKPFRTQTLATKIREILDGRSSTGKIQVLRSRRPSSLIH